MLVLACLPSLVPPEVFQSGWVLQAAPVHLAGHPTQGTDAFWLHFPELL